MSLKSSGSGRSFGGPWSDIKLDALERYLKAYTTALKNQPFKIGYIDAFAGAGEIPSNEGSDEDDQHDLPLEDTDYAAEAYRHGSPLIALETTPPFDSFVFIDNDSESMAELQNQIEQRGLSDRKLHFQLGDANAKLVELSGKNWKEHRAVAFLDPFAMQLRWETLQAIAGTKSIDMWLLFPAMAVSRVLPRSGEVPEAWQHKLNETFGSDGWKTAFYAEEAPNLFGESTVKKLEGFYERLSSFVTDRLRTIFPGVTKHPLILRNSCGSPIFLLCFACANPNPRAIGAALRIAEHIIKTH